MDGGLLNDQWLVDVRFGALRTQVGHRAKFRKVPQTDVSKRSICCAMISSPGRDQPGAQSPVGRSNTVVRRYPDDPTDHRHGLAAHATCLRRPFWRICTGS